LSKRAAEVWKNCFASVKFFQKRDFLPASYAVRKSKGYGLVKNERSWLSFEAGEKCGLICLNLSTQNQIFSPFQES
jgi:hypothetical protein